ncbi:MULTISPECIES: type II secretion system F family protein [unclassified Nocardioides]|uniref:type II secretion system F family protein n=1 Tax=unclassified Nocardioides TaxID=2615069 RepID=UPI0009EF9AD2|nr:MULTISPECIES: type II secretion system F family protein [unclassified Nocardioides]GAW52571.1 integral membrane protein [Nocardioides sp. PD653-B2]GAW55590.1 integral membrane protein [Nocardioides sp. PD653]
MGAFLGCVLALCLGVIGFIRTWQGKPPLPARVVTSRRKVVDHQQLAKSVTIALAAGVVVGVLTRWPVAAAMAVAVVALWPKIARSGAIEKTSVAWLEALANWTESLRDAAAAESGLAQALPATVDGAPMLLRRPLRNLVNAIELRTPMPVALADFAAEINHRAADKVVIALVQTFEQQSGSLKRVLTTLALDTRAELELRRKVLSERNGVRRQSNQVVLAILGLALVQAVFLRSWVSPYSTVAGQGVLALIAIAFLGLLWRLQQLAAPEPQPRFLAGVEALMETTTERTSS